MTECILTIIAFYIVYLIYLEVKKYKKGRFQNESKQKDTNGY